MNRRPNFPPTDEQQAIIDAFMSGGDLAITALAGSGKTTCLRFLALARIHDIMTYIAFNKSIATDAKGLFSSNVIARTAHSFAFRAVGRAYADRLEGARVPSWKVADILNIPDRWDFGDYHLRGKQMARLVMDAVNRYCHSAVPDPQPFHIPRVPGLDSEVAYEALCDVLYPYLLAAWADIRKTCGQLRFGHDYYLKMWSLEDPVLPGSVILVDEAQDLDPVIALIIAQQNARKVYVGDENQAIYGWRNAIDELSKVDVDYRLPLQKCQPTGTMVQVPVRLSSRPDFGPRLPVWGYRDVPIESISIGDRVVSRTQKNERGGKSWAHGCLRLAGSVVTDISVRSVDESLVVVTAGEFTSRYALNHHCIVRLGGEDGSGKYQDAVSPLRDKHAVYMMRRNGQYRVGRCPWFYPRVGLGPKRRAWMEGAESLWVLSTHDSKEDAALAEALVSWRFNIPDASFTDHGSDYTMPLNEFWAKVGDNEKNAVSCLSHYGLLAEEPLWSNSQVLRGSIWITAAANVVSGMSVLTVSPEDRTERWCPAFVSREWYTGDIYSLSVADDHTYVADGIVTHNSFRFGPDIAEEANRLLTLLQSDLRVVGHDPVNSRLAVVEDPDVILCRTNAAAVGRLMEAQVSGLRAALVGGTAQVEALARAAMKLNAGERTDHPELMAFENWTQVQDYVSGDTEGKELKVLVDLVDTHGAPALLEAVQQAVPEPEAERIISTGHRAKGREWDRVRLDEDFPIPTYVDLDTGRRKLRKEEVRLAYVVATRAKLRLDSRALRYLDPVAATLGQQRIFAVPAEDEEPTRTAARALPTEQVIPDPEHPERLMFRRVRYDARLVEEQRRLPGRRFFRSYCAEENVNVVDATFDAIEVAERFGLTISDAARLRVRGSPGAAPAAGSQFEPARE